MQNKIRAVPFLFFAFSAAILAKDNDSAARQLALETAAKHLHLPQDQLQVESLEAVDWRDSSLGCPKPGHRYLSVIIPGYRAAVVTEGQAAGKKVDVHMGRGRALVCEGVLRKGG